MFIFLTFLTNIRGINFKNVLLKIVTYFLNERKSPKIIIEIINNFFVMRVQKENISLNMSNQTLLFYQKMEMKYEIIE